MLHYGGSRCETNPSRFALRWVLLLFVVDLELITVSMTNPGCSCYRELKELQVHPAGKEMGSDFFWGFIVYKMDCAASCLKLL